MIRAEKEKFVESLKGEFGEMRNAFLVGFQGLNVQQINDLRRKIKATSSHMKVLKNRLAARATVGTPLAELAPHFEGPLAMAYNSGEPATLAKVLVEFAKANPQLVFRAGVAETRSIDAATFETLASLPTREALVARVLGLFKSPQQRLLRVLSSPLHNLLAVLKQLEAAKSKQG
ncbi:MAG: 50S ribosomal protein L10 [Acidobacteriota bacterium]|nr:50S ribosomal protein L10 [Acidobacteriota bacterium]